MIFFSRKFMRNIILSNIYFLFQSKEFSVYLRLRRMQNKFGSCNLFIYLFVGCRGRAGGVSECVCQALLCDSQNVFVLFVSLYFWKLTGLHHCIAKSLDIILFVKYIFELPNILFPHFWLCWWWLVLFRLQSMGRRREALDAIAERERLRRALSGCRAWCTTNVFRGEAYPYFFFGNCCITK